MANKTNAQLRKQYDQLLDDALEILQDKVNQVFKRNPKLHTFSMALDALRKLQDIYTSINYKG